MNEHSRVSRTTTTGTAGGSAATGGCLRHSEAAERIAADLLAKGARLLVVKSQIQAGGRGKGTFKNGFKGGVKLCRTAAEVRENAAAMLGNILVTKQTGPEGKLVSKLIVALAPDIRKELYWRFCWTAHLHGR